MILTLSSPIRLQGRHSALVCGRSIFSTQILYVASQSIIYSSFASPVENNYFKWFRYILRMLFERVLVDILNPVRFLKDFSNAFELVDSRNILVLVLHISNHVPASDKR